MIINNSNFQVKKQILQIIKTLNKIWENLEKIVNKNKKKRV